MNSRIQKNDDICTVSRCKTQVHPALSGKRTCDQYRLQSCVSDAVQHPKMANAGSLKEPCSLFSDVYARASTTVAFLLTGQSWLEKIISQKSVPISIRESHYGTIAEWLRNICFLPFLLTLSILLRFHSSFLYSTHTVRLVERFLLLKTTIFFLRNVSIAVTFQWFPRTRDL